MFSIDECSLKNKKFNKINVSDFVILKKFQRLKMFTNKLYQYTSENIFLNIMENGASPVTTSYFYY